VFPEGGEVLSGVMAGEFLHRLRRVTKVRLGEPMALHTTFRVGGPAACYALPESVAALKATLELCREYSTPHVILGAGSNVLFPDRAYPGVVISTGRFDRFVIDPPYADIAAGVRIGPLLNRLHQAGIRSLDFLSGIPGTLGGVIAMNAGIPARTISDAVECVWAIDETGEISRFDSEESCFSYRGSLFRETRLPILGARLRLDGPSYDGARLLSRRLAHQPLHSPSAGCVFKNPPDDSAGRLIEAVGLKGFRVGMAKVSEKHANFILNLGGARSVDIRKLIDIVRQKVYKSFRISLELEIEVIDGCTKRGD